MGDALHEAVKGGHLEIVSDLLESGASTAATDGDGRTPLHIAAHLGESEIVQTLLLKGADKDAFGAGKWTPLYLAAYRGHVAPALTLLAAGADVSLPCGPYETPVLHAAAEQGHVEILRAMIKHGADVEAVDYAKETALHYAAWHNKTDAIDALVKAGANIEARNWLGFTPLHTASDGLSHEGLLTLLKHGATVNSQDDFLGSPLMTAACKAGGRQGAAELVDALLRSGVDETTVNRESRKALDLISADVREEDRLLAEDAERVRELLAYAPADRMWRRRGYLVLCRAHPHRLQQSLVNGGKHHADKGRGNDSSCAKLARAEASGCHDTVGGSNVDGLDGGDWAAVVAKVLRLQEDGIFRTILGCL